MFFGWGLKKERLLVNRGFELEYELHTTGNGARGGGDTINTAFLD
jgi:hypothetical protein